MARPHSRTGSKGAAVVVALPEARELRAEHVEHLRTSGLTDETLALACLYSESNRMRLPLLIERRWLTVWGNAIVFPVYLPGESVPYGYRVRADNPRSERRANGKLRTVKYDQSRAAGVLVYYPPRARAASVYGDPSVELLWTEGEKKALALDQIGLTCVGLTGVWNWSDPDGDDDGERLHPRIAQHVAVAGRAHVIVFDADARANDKVMLAASRLCGVLCAAGAASVRFVCPPEGGPKGIDDYYVAHGEAATRALLSTAAHLEPADPRQPRQRLRKCRALRDAPLDESLVLPDGYELQKNGSLWIAAAIGSKKGDVPVTHTPMYIARKLYDLYTDDERVELVYDRGGEGWRSVLVSRRAIADSRTMVAELAGAGAPVTSGSASKIVDWLDALEHINARMLPRVPCVARCGWHVLGGVHAFAAHAIYTSADESPLVIDTRGDRKKLSEALAPRGKLDAHVAALKRAWAADPVAAAMICASFAAPLLHRLGAPNFAVHLPGESSRGKTSLLKMAASVYGDPESAHWLASWNVTASGAELRAASLCDLPQCYDEVGGGDMQAIERLVYTLINGGGRTRSTRELALRETASWRTIVLSTGERELADESSATGAQVRVLHLPVDGIGSLTADEIDALREACGANAGCAGAEWLACLAKATDDDWLEWRAALTRVLAAMRARTSDPLQGRIARYFALLVVCEQLIADVIGVGDEHGATMQRLFEAMPSREPVEGLGVRALELVEQWAFSDPDAFPALEMTSSGELAPSATRSGKARAGLRRGDTLLLTPSAFRAFCGTHGLSSRQVLREWQRVGRLVHDVGRLDKLQRIGTKRHRFHAVSLAESAE